MEMLERLLYGIVVLFCILAVIAGVIFAFMLVCLDRSGPRNYPDDWDEYVWISEEPRAFITRGRPSEKGIGLLGGQMEIDGEIQTIGIHIEAPGDYSIAVALKSYTVSQETGRFISTENPQSVFYSKTKYKPDRIVCKVGKNSEYFAGQKIVFVRYDRDEVTPADFGFELESWDDFVLVVDSLPDDEPTPTPMPTPEPAAPPPEYAYAYARARAAGD